MAYTDPNISLNIQPVQSVNPLESYARVMALNHAMQQQQLGAEALRGERLQNQQRETAIKDDELMRQTYMEVGGDPEKALQLAAQRGVGPKIIQSMQQFLLEHAQKRATLKKTEAETHDLKRDAINAAMQPVFAEQDPAKQEQLWNQASALLQQNGTITPQEAQDHPYPGADGVKGYAASLVTDKWVTAQANKLRADAAARQATTAESRETRETEDSRIRRRRDTLEGDILENKLNIMKNTSPADIMALVDQVVPPDIKENAALNARTKALANAAMKRGDVEGAKDAIKQAAAEVRQLEVATDPRIKANKIEISAATGAARANAIADAAGLTVDDYQRAGEQYMRTGIMPAMGRDSVTRGKIVHAGNNWARDNGFSAADIVTMQAAYAGDKESLKKFKVQRDQIVSFEQTAQKNLDLMLAAGQKLIDTGSPLLNKPLREIARTGLGSDAQAAFDAAQLIANNEVAKVTSGGGLGGVVSDTAKREMQDAMGKNPTIGNMMAVAKILKQDMANRHQSMDATLEDIKSHIGWQPGATGAGGNGGQQQPQYKRTATGANGHKIGTNDNGQTWYDVQSGQKVQ